MTKRKMTECEACSRDIPVRTAKCPHCGFYIKGQRPEPEHRRDTPRHGCRVSGPWDGGRENE